MATVTTLQRLKDEGQHSRSMTGEVTGNFYVADPLGRVVVDTRDAAAMLSRGWVVFTPSTPASAGTTQINFGVFPGSSSATTTVTPAGPPTDPNAQLDVWITPVATADHSVDEHLCDPPAVAGQVSGGSIIITGYPSGRDLAVPPGTPFGNTANSQMSTGNQQLMPYGAWSVAWAFST